MGWFEPSCTAVPCCNLAGKSPLVAQFVTRRLVETLANLHSPACRCPARALPQVTDNCFSFLYGVIVSTFSAPLSFFACMLHAI